MVRTQKEAIEFLSNIPYIHRGGCLISAFAFILNEKRAGRSVPYIVGCGTDEEKENNLDFVKNNIYTAMSGAHFGWQYANNNTIYDCMKSNAFQSYYDFYTYKIPKHMTIKFCLNALENGAWNSFFQRGVEVPKIMRFFGLQRTKFKQIPF